MKNGERRTKSGERRARGWHRKYIRNRVVGKVRGSVTSVKSRGVLSHLKSLDCSCSYFEFLISLSFFFLFPYLFTIFVKFIMSPKVH